MDIYEAIHQRRSHRMYKPEMPPKKRWKAGRSTPPSGPPSGLTPRPGK